MTSARGTRYAAAWLLCTLMALLCAGRALAETACTHPNMDSYFGAQNKRDYAAISSGRHSYTCDVYQHWYCPLCDMILTELVETGVKMTDRCRYGSGETCITCGRSSKACPHDRMREYKEIDVDSVKVISSDSRMHTYTADILAYHYCPDCGVMKDRRVVKKGARFTEEHDPWFLCTEEGSRCELCGYEEACAHKNVQPWTNIYSISRVLSAGAGKHTLLCNIVQEQCCTDCGKVLSSTPVVHAELTDEHYYDVNGVCEDCGYKTACTHKNVKTVQWYDTMYNVEALDSAHHGFFSDMWQCGECQDCGLTIDEIKLVDNGYFAEEHAYDNRDVCVVCGAAKAEGIPVASQYGVVMGSADAFARMQPVTAPTMVLPDGKGSPTDLALRVEETDAGGGSSVTYDVELINSQGETVELSAGCILCFPYPEGMDAAGMRPYRITIRHYDHDKPVETFSTDEGTIELTEQGLCILVSSLSPFEITWEAQPAVDLPKTGDSSRIGLWLAMLALAGAVLAALRRKTA